MNEPEIDEDVFVRNAYVLGAVLMRDNIVKMFMEGKSIRYIKAMYPPEPDVDHLRRMEVARLQNIAEQ